MDYTQEQVEVIKRTWAKKTEKKKKEEQEKRTEAIRKAREVALFLKKSYEVEEVYLFGSLAWRKRFTPHSDIDLYIKSFPKDKSYWEALAKSERIATPFPVSLVLAETARPKMREKIEKEGIML